MDEIQNMYYCITTSHSISLYSQNKPISYYYYHFKSDDKSFHSKNGSEKISVETLWVGKLMNI